MPEVDPSILAALNEERGVAASSGRNYRSLQLDRGEAALVRFLPAQLGPRKTWFARIARHWVGKRPILCVKQTSADFGGDPRAHCPLCDLEAQFAQDRNKDIQDAARKMGAFPKWLTYVFVWETINDRGHKIKTPKEEVFLPNEYWVSRDGFKELSSMWERSLGSIPTYGFLDPVKGYDIEVERDNRNGYRHRRCDPVSIDDSKTVDELFEIIDEAMRHVKLPDTNPPSADQLDEAVEKAQDALSGRSSGRRDRRSESDVDYDSDRRGGGGRSRDDDRGSSRGYDRGSSRDDRGSSRDDDRRPGRSEDPEPRSGRDDPPARDTRREDPPARSESRRDDPPARDSHRDEPPARSESRRDPPPAPREAEGDDRREPPARETRREAPPARETRREAPPAAESRRQAPPPPAGRGSPESDFDAVPGRGDTGEPEGDQAPTGTEEAPPPVRASGGTAAPSRRQAPPPPAREGGRIVDDPEELPRERRDPAPPEGGAKPASTAQAPAPSSEPQRKLSDSMRSRVSRIGGAQL